MRIISVNLLRKYLEKRIAEQGEIDGDAPVFQAVDAFEEILEIVNKMSQNIDAASVENKMMAHALTMSDTFNQEETELEKKPVRMHFSELEQRVMLAEERATQEEYRTFSRNPLKEQELAESAEKLFGTLLPKKEDK